jgi:hypothetical protein
MTRQNESEQLEISLPRDVMYPLEREAKARYLSPAAYASVIVSKVMQSSIDGRHSVSLRDIYEAAMSLNNPPKETYAFRFPKIQVSFQSTRAVREEVAHLATRSMKSQSVWFENQVKKVLQESDGPTGFYDGRMMQRDLTEVLTSGLEKSEATWLGQNVSCVYRISQEVKGWVDERVGSSWASASALYQDAIYRAVAKAYMEPLKKEPSHLKYDGLTNTEPMQLDEREPAHANPWRPWGDQEIRDKQIILDLARASDGW